MYRKPQGARNRPNISRNLKKEDESYGEESTILLTLQTPS
jgi:hypothetical protein